MSFCFLYNIVSENHSVQNSPWGWEGGGGLLPAQGLYLMRRSAASALGLQCFHNTLKRVSGQKMVNSLSTREEIS